MSIASISAADKSALATLARGIVEWFPSGGREFSWRATDWDTYRLIVTELFLQRTRAETDLPPSNESSFQLSTGLV